MRAWTSPLCAAALAMFTATAARADEPVSITLAHGSAVEQQTQQRLLDLLAHHDFSRWTFTRKIVIDEDEIPHSHPVLTLHARHRHDDELLASTYVHEQMHWFLAAHPDDLARATARLRTLYPKIPVGYPEGSADEAGNYEHLLVIWLEMRADQQLFGELRTWELMHFWAEDHYTWLYRTVAGDPRAIGAVAREFHLLPPG
jgi:hypothetical protein